MTQIWIGNCMSFWKLGMVFRNLVFLWMACLVQLSFQLPVKPWNIFILILRITTQEINTSTKLSTVNPEKKFTLELGMSVVVFMHKTK